MQQKNDFSPMDCVNFISSKGFNVGDLLLSYINEGTIPNYVDQRTAVIIYNCFNNLSKTELLDLFGGAMQKYVYQGKVGVPPMLATDAETSLKNKIIYEAGKYTGALAKMKAAYLTLNRSVVFNSSLFDNPINKQIVDFYSSKSLDSVGQDNRVICSTWSQLYREALVAIGVNPTNIHLQERSSADGGVNHKWIEVDLSDVMPGYILLADATDSVKGVGVNDISRIRIGLSIEEFMIVPKELSGIRIAASLKPRIEYNKIKDADRYVDESDRINKAIDQEMTSQKTKKNNVVDFINKVFSGGNKR